MSRSRLLARGVLGAVGAALLVPFLLGSRLQDVAARGPGGLALFEQVRGLVADRYVDARSDSALFEAAARGLVAQLDDPYAELVTPQQVQAFDVGAYGRYGGLGMLLEDHAGRFVVRRVYPGTPAAGAGVREGDAVVAVDSASVAGWPLARVTKALKGPAGTSVRATFERPGVAEPIAFTLVRAVVHTPAVPYALMLDDRVGYVPLEQFSEASAGEARAAVTRLLAEGARALVLDLRGNGGGVVGQALATSALFLPEGSMVARVVSRVGAPETLTTRSAPVSGTTPLVVLLDGNSASATEIVAGALQDHDRALVVGQTSFGKGLVQSVFPLDGGYLLKLTTGRWFTPSGRSIHKPRKLVDGRLVDDTTTLATSARPVYHSDAGRVVYGGGAITPDLAVRGDTLAAVDRRVLAALAPQSQPTYLWLYDLAAGERGRLAPDFRVPAAWRETLWRRLDSAGVRLPHATYDSAAATLDRLLGDQVARLAFGDSTARRRSLPYDPALQRALELLHAARSQGEVFARAETGGRQDG
ncbi:MAG TPA: S41 family peptidase [Gemmatimonadales bacterium]|nr:S41 family peptidase [Gemmatimonadales bacterium]